MYGTTFFIVLLHFFIIGYTQVAADTLQTTSVAATEYRDSLTKSDGTFGSRWYPATSEARERLTDPKVPQLIFEKNGTDVLIVVPDPTQNTEVEIEFKWRLEGSRFVISVPNTTKSDHAVTIKPGTYTISIQRVTKGFPALTHETWAEMAEAFYLITFDASPVNSSNEGYATQWIRPIERQKSKE